MNLVPSNHYTIVFFTLGFYNKIFNIITYMKNRGSIHDISIKFLKLYSSHIYIYLSDFFNMCIDTGVFPDRSKLAHSTLIFKNGSKSAISNHRPISVLLGINKIFESLINCRWKNFLDRYNIYAKAVWISYWTEHSS